MTFENNIKLTNSANSFMLHNGITLTAMEKDYAKVEARLSRENRNLYNAVHGGMFLTMGDCAAGGAARTNGMRYVTIDTGFQFYRNTESDHLIAEGRIKHRGSTLCVAEVEIHDGEGTLLCGGTFTLYCTGKLDEYGKD